MLDQRGLVPGRGLAIPSSSRSTARWAAGMTAVLACQRRRRAHGDKQFAAQVAPFGEQPRARSRVAPVRRRDNDLRVRNDLEIGTGDEARAAMNSHRLRTSNPIPPRAAAPAVRAGSAPWSPASPQGHRRHRGRTAPPSAATRRGRAAHSPAGTPRDHPAALISSATAGRRPLARFHMPGVPFEQLASAVFLACSLASTHRSTP